MASSMYLLHNECSFSSSWMLPKLAYLTIAQCNEDIKRLRLFIYVKFFSKAIDRFNLFGNTDSQFMIGGLNRGQEY
jgi:hypothetical protein